MVQMSVLFKRIVKMPTQKGDPMIKAGLIRGRHEMPVDLYIFDSIENVHDYDSMRKVINDFLLNVVGITRSFGVGINQADMNDAEIFRGKDSLTLYVTGLTAVTAEVIAACARNGIELTLMNYDLTSGNYVAQRLF